jgi:mRNA interferase RelE/StbE
VLKLQLSRESQKFLDSLPPKQFRQIAKKVFSLMENPLPHDSQEMKGYPFIRNDIGEYRIIYDVQEGTLRIVLVGKRNDDEIFKKLGRSGVTSRK